MKIFSAARSAWAAFSVPTLVQPAPLSRKRSFFDFKQPGRLGLSLLLALGLLFQFSGPALAAPETTADRVYGQGGAFNTGTINKGGLSADSLYNPYGVAVDSAGGLYVADPGNRRVLHFPSGSSTADVVYGQGGAFNTGTINKGGLSADSLSFPFGVAVDSAGGLYVADLNNQRVLHYPSGSTTADVVYGQGGAFNTSTANNGGISANSLYGLIGVAVDSAGGLYVADTSNNRVLYFSNVPPTLMVSPTTLNFTATAGGANPVAQNVAVGNLTGTNGPLDWSLSAISYGPGATGWLSCTPTSGTSQAAGTSTNVSCQPTTGVLTPGTYTASFNVTSATSGVAGSPKTVNISFTVQTPPTLTVTPTTLNYTATAGGANPVAQTITVGNIVGANGPLDWNVGTISYGPGATGWLSCTPASGTGLAAGMSTNTSCQPTTGALTPGTYTASFDITSSTPLVAGSPKTVNVTFVVETPPTLTASPTTLSFTATAGGANPVAQTITVGNIAGANAALDWNVGTISYGPGATGWLSCTPTSGTGLAAGTTTNASCQPATGALTPGTYTASFNVTSATSGVAGSPKTVNISFAVQTPPTLTTTPTSLSFTATVGGSNPAAQNITIGNIAGANGPLDWNVGTVTYGPGATGWLNCTPTSGTGLAAGTSTNVSCQPTTGALAAGTYTASFDITSVTPGVAGSPKTVNVTFVLNPPPTLTVTPTNLNYTATGGGANPVAQNITVGNIVGANGPLDWNVGTISYGPGATGWLNCTPTSGTSQAAGTTTNVSCQPTTGALAAGTYTASFDITSSTPGVAGSPKTVNVSFTVQTPPTLTITPTTLNYTATAGGANPVAQNVAVGNIAGANAALNWNVGTISYGPGATGWLSCTPTSGTGLAAGTSTNVSCQPTTGALTPGTYTASFNITSATPLVAGSPKTVNVTFVVETPPTLTASPTTLNFTATAGGANPVAQNVAVGNIAGANAALDWNVGTISYGPGATGWLSCTPASGTNQAAGTSTNVNCQPTTGSLTPGTYTASFNVTSTTSGVAGSPKTVNISFAVQTPPTLTTTPTSLSFTATVGGSNPAAQNITIGNIAGANGPLDWNVGTVTYGPGATGWLNCTPASGTGLAAGTTTNVSCQPTTGALAAGTYTASFDITSATPLVAGSPKTVNVSFTVQTPPTLTVMPTTLNYTATAGGANPAAQNITVGNIVGANGPLDWNVGTISYGPGATGWLSCTPTSGTGLAAGTSTNVSCQPTTGPLTPGTYTASFDITSATPLVAGSPKTVNVTFVLNPPPTLTVTPTSLNYTATAGGANPVAQNVVVGNITGANAALDWNIGTISYGPGATGWLNCTPTNGTGQAAGTSTNVNCQPTTGALAAGTYTASFNVTSSTPGVAGSPKTVNISFTVAQGPVLTVTPTSLNFVAQAGSTNPAAQNITIGNLAGANGPLDWNIGTISYGPGATGWLSCTPTSGTNQAAGTSTPVSCQPTTGALSAGTYTASFDVTSSTPGATGSPKTVNLTFTISAAPPPPATPGYGSSPAPGSTWLLGKSKVGQPVNANLAISETGGATLTVSNPVLGGTNAAEFNITNAASFPLSIPDGGPAQNLVVQCKPSALGTRTATLTLTTNDPTQPTVSYNLQCNGVKEERNPTPADLVGQLRLTPDRLANLDPSTLITVSFKLTNLGPGRADSVRLTFPLDPNLVVGYTSFSDNRMWVSELVTEGEKPYLRVGLPAVEAKQSFSGQIVFRPSAGAADKAKVMLRYVLGWDDEEAAGKQSVSNGVHFRLSREASRNESDGEVQPFEPGELTIVAGTSSLKLSADFYASNEIVTLWYTDASGQSFSLGQQSADREGKLNFEVATASLSVGQTYTIVGYGNRSGISGTSAVTITTP